MFEILQIPKNKQFYFRLKSRNGQIILTSESYKSRASCKNGIKSVQKNAAKESNFELKEAKNGKFYFTLNARNGEPIGASQMYRAKHGRKKGIAAVMRVAPGAEVRDLTA